MNSPKNDSKNSRKNSPKNSNFSKINSNISMYPYNDCFPEIADTVFLADGVRIIGDVKIETDCGIWYNTVIRGDVHYIRIAERTNIQDNCLLHVTHDTAPLLVGRGVTVGHQAILHSCTVGDYSLIGMGAIVLDKAVIEEYSFVAAGAVVKPGFVVPSGTLAAGIPARIVRDLRPEEMEDLPASADRYFDYAALSRRGMGGQTT